MKPEETKRTARGKMLLALSAVFLCTFVTRGAILAIHFGDRQFMMDGDGEDYYDIASNLYSGFGIAQTVYPEDGSRAFTESTARRPPLYPLFACGTFYLGELVGWGGVAFPTIIIQVFIDGLTAMLVCLIARELAGWRAGLIAGLLYGLNLQLAKFPAQFMSETLFTFLQTGGVWMLLRGVAGSLTNGVQGEHTEPTQRGRSSLLFFAGAGLLLGLATLARPVILLFPGVAAAWLVLRSEKEWKRALPSAAVMLGAFVLCLMPWMIRNKSVLEKFVVVSTVGGQTFFHSNHSTSNGTWVPLEIPAEAKGLTEPERDAYYYRKGLEFIFGHPLTSLKNSIKKVLRLYYVFYPEYDWHFGISICLILPGLYVWTQSCKTQSAGCPLKGAVISPFSLPLLLVIYTTILCAIFWGQPRFRAPLMPCLLCFAGYYLSWIPALANKKKHLIYTAAAVTVNVLIALLAEPIRMGLEKITG
ncbi:MAG: hypothetical protein QF473_12540 [Planctomycetota bacterium]|jgi:4-amino-4-deoxy-L-arabinose transferase-like glycosyltransferase|nr:hypothetical protein [Planctomycetota bacterium]